jgi:hypothetical protein
MKYGREEEKLREGGENKGEMRYKTEGSGEISDEGERRRRWGREESEIRE